MRKGLSSAILAASLTALYTGPAAAALPFITDDAGTLGKGTSQVELWYTRSTDKETIEGLDVITERDLPGATFGYGVADPLDVTLGLAREWGQETVAGVSANDAGIALFTLSAKWRLYAEEKSGFCFAVKPLVGYSYLVGGMGEDYTATLGGWLITTKEYEPLSVSLNVGYLFNHYGSVAERDGSKSSLWSASALVTYEVIKGLKLGGDVGAWTNQDKTDSTIPVYALAGAIYSPNRNIDLSLGLKFGVTRPEPDFAWTAGITFRF